MVKKGSKTVQNDEAAIQPEDNNVFNDAFTTSEGSSTAKQTVETASGVDVDPMTAVKMEADKNLDGWQRTLAEFQNYKRRVEREQMALWSKASLDTVTDLLPILDDFERALANIPEGLKENSWVNGLVLIQTKFTKLLEEYGVAIIDPVGEEFNPNQHQAVGTSDSDEYESGQVIQTLQKGYLSDNTLLRPALVMVAN